MSSSSQNKQTEVLGELVHELRQCYGLGASFFRAAAARIEMTDTDMQVLDILESTGDASAGQIADLMGLTTGTFTGILNRLEKAELVQRERDPNDGRRVIVRLAMGSDDRHKVGPLFDSIGKAWREMASHYDQEQMALLLEFLQRSNTVSRKEIVRLREAPLGEREIFSAPLAELSSARLVVSSGISRLTVRADEAMAELYQARFEGQVPSVVAKEGGVTIRYPRRLWVPGREQRVAEVNLSVAIPWRIVIQGGASEIEARLLGLNLAGLEVKAGASMIRLELPTPSGTVPIRISGGVSGITIWRPAGVAARVHLKGWISSALVFDDQTFRDVGNDVRLQSPGYQVTTPCYDIEVAGSANDVTITSG
ncbi:MAG: MarR family transcriptional regulator [Herpetosiphonaceae bacterium]|nr:MarR family transcriptional regulator [Herpetosiphonaceae bacterium]